MPLVSLEDKQEIERFLRRNVYLHLYAIGDLDDFFWPHTAWHGWKTGETITALALIYTGSSVPTLLALSEHTPAMAELLEGLRGLLPRRFYAHLSPGLEGVFEGTHRLEPHGPHYKMALRDPQRVLSCDCSGVVRLGEADLAEIQEFYGVNYPGNWFDPRMLQTNQYFGLRERDTLVSVAGVHVYSRQYRVAALGNVATHASYRNRGCARRVTARLCQSLAEEVDHIGLNVKCGNRPAIACYERLGFEIVASYGEFMIELGAMPTLVVGMW